jgi:hypothetical protein
MESEFGVGDASHNPILVQSRTTDCLCTFIFISRPIQVQASEFMRCQPVEWWYEIPQAANRVVGRVRHRLPATGHVVAEELLAP